MGFADENGPRLVATPWFPEPVPFEEAAATGTEKVIAEHSTVGVVLLNDGSFGDLPAEAYVAPGQKVIEELQELGKPFVVVVNSADPDGTAANELASEIAARYGVTALIIDVLHMTEADIMDVLDAALYEFPVSEIDVSLPLWVETLEPTHWLRARFEQEVNQAAAAVKKIRDVGQLLERLRGQEIMGEVALRQLDLGQGSAAVDVAAADGLFYRVLSEYADTPVRGEQDILPLLRRYSVANREWNRLRGAMAEVAEHGYGVVEPALAEMYLDEPELIKQGGHFGVKLRASAPSYHIIRADVATEITPLIGTEKQCEDLLRYIMDEFEEDPQKIWKTDIFGKSLYELVTEGVSSRLGRIPEQTREKLAETLQRIVNDSGGGIICIIL